MTRGVKFLQNFFKSGHCYAHFIKWTAEPKKKKRLPEEWGLGIWLEKHFLLLLIIYLFIFLSPNALMFFRIPGSRPLGHLCPLHREDMGQALVDPHGELLPTQCPKGELRWGQKADARLSWRSF